MANVAPECSLDKKQRAELAALIDHRRSDIEQRWLELVQAEVARNIEISPTDLRNAMGDYLRLLAESLRRERSSNESVDSEAWVVVAKEHALTRVRIGFDIEQLVHEFILLRKVLIHFARDAGLLIDTYQAERLTDLIEAAICVSVGTYVRSRDYEFRRTEAEHVGFITHELRNPLTTAKLAASQICRETHSSAERGKLCTLLESNLSRLEELISTVLLNEKLQALSIKVNPIDTNLGMVLQDSIRNATETARRKGLRFKSAFDAQIPLHIDPSLTRSAVDNLLDNALKYTDAGTVEISVEHLPNEIVLHVKDQCHGLSKEELATIFEPFKRGHSGKPGTGLGLTIARRSIEIQGGHIQVESSDYEGCHFWINLPKKVSEEKNTLGKTEDSPLRQRI